MNKLLVFIETEKDEIVSVSLEIISHCAHCVHIENSFPDLELNGIILTTDEYKNSLIDKLQNKGLTNLFVSVDNKFKNYSSQAFTTVITDFLRHNAHQIFLTGATPLGRELAPRIAARNDLGLTADCTQIDIDEDCNLLATRPTYGGQLMATITSKTTPNFATIRPGALKRPDTYFEKSMDVTYYNSDLDNIFEAIKILKTEAKNVANDLEGAQIVVAGGLGMKTKENFDLIHELAALIGAKPAASRGAVELGWASQSIQVGQTGHSVAPKIYIAFGISGAMQHLVGIENADRIIAINTDKNAPIFESADVGIVTDAPVFLRELIEKLSMEQ